MSGIKTVDREDMCLHCRQDTKFGSGRFVNRYPAEIFNDELKVVEVGYGCAECEEKYYKPLPE